MSGFKWPDRRLIAWLGVASGEDETPAADDRAVFLRNTAEVWRKQRPTAINLPAAGPCSARLKMPDGPSLCEKWDVSSTAEDVFWEIAAERRG